MLVNSEPLEVQPGLLCLKKKKASQMILMHKQDWNSDISNTNSPLVRFLGLELVRILPYKLLKTEMLPDKENLTTKESYLNLIAHKAAVAPQSVHLQAILEQLQ